jgi:hypothetical protein
VRALAGALALFATAAPGATAKVDVAGQRALLKDWTLTRCVGRGLGPGKAQEDAFASASALLERGQYDIAVYNRLDTLVDAQLARKYGGSVPGEFVMLKCLDLYHGAALARAVAGARLTPVR